MAATTITLAIRSRAASICAQVIARLAAKSSHFRDTRLSVMEHHHLDFCRERWRKRDHEARRPMRRSCERVIKFAFISSIIVYDLCLEAQMSEAESTRYADKNFNATQRDFATWLSPNSRSSLIKVRPCLNQWINQAGRESFDPRDDDRRAGGNASSN